MAAESAEPLRVLRAFTVSKRDDLPNEDRFRVSEDRTCCAVSDGASVSFDSGPWAEILCDQFIESRNITIELIADAAQRYAKLYDRDSMSSSVKKPIER